MIRTREVGGANVVTIVAGVDVGSGHPRKSTGLCRTRDVRFLVARVTGDGAERPRERVLPRRCDVLAVGGPVVRPGFPPDALRSVERVFSLGVFQKRCKPNATGKSGREFRNASSKCLEQVIANVRTSRELLRFPHVVPDTSIVEAAPIVFLSVLIDDDVHESRRRMNSTTKFSWLLERCRDSGKLASLREALDWPDDELWSEVAKGRGREQLSAAICSLTAICVVRRRYVAVGDLRAGFFFLPPWDLWADWAKEGVGENRRRPEVGDGVEVWINAYPRDRRAKLPA